MPVPYTFATATSAIPLSQLDNNFATPITIGNTAVQLGNTITTINNLTLANVTITSGTSNTTLANGSVTNVMLAGSITNDKLQNNAVTLGNVTISLGGSSSNIGNLALANVLVSNYIESTYTANTGSALTLNLTNGTFDLLTLTANTTLTMPSAVAGKSFILLLNTGSGGYSVTWSTVKWSGGTAPTVTSTASKTDIYSFFSDGTNWYGVTVAQNF